MCKMSDFVHSSIAAVAALLAFCGYVNEDDRVEVEPIPGGGGFVLSVTREDHLMPWGYLLAAIIGIAFISTAIRRLAIKEAPKPIATQEPIEEFLDAIDKTDEETLNPDEESLDSVAQEIIDVVNEDTSNSNPSPGEPIAKSTPNKEGNGKKIIKRVTHKITMTNSPKK